MNMFFLVRWSSLLGVVLMVSAARGNASDFFYYFKSADAGSASSTLQPPVSVLFQNVTPGTVNLTISNTGLNDSEFLRRLYFNLSPDLNPSSLRFDLVDSSGGFKLPSILKRTNGKPVQGGGNFDFGFRFATSKPQRFGAGEFVAYQITGIPNLTADDFIALSSPRHESPTYYGAAFIRPGTSKIHADWIFAPDGAVPASIPEPSSSLLLLLAGGLSFIARPMLKRNSAGQ